MQTTDFNLDEKILAFFERFGGKNRLGRGHGLLEVRAVQREPLLMGVSQHFVVVARK